MTLRIFAALHALSLGLLMAGCEVSVQREPPDLQVDASTQEQGGDQSTGDVDDLSSRNPDFMRADVDGLCPCPPGSRCCVRPGELPICIPNRSCCTDAECSGRRCIGHSCT